MARRKRNQTTDNHGAQSTLPPAADERLDVPMLETRLWDAACAIRGATDAPKFKDFILPLIFFKRLSDVFDDEFAFHVQEYEDESLTREIIKARLLDELMSGKLSTTGLINENDVIDKC